MQRLISYVRSGHFDLGLVTFYLWDNGDYPPSIWLRTPTGGWLIWWLDRGPWDLTRLPGLTWREWFRYLRRDLRRSSPVRWGAERIWNDVRVRLYGLHVKRSFIGIVRQDGWSDEPAPDPSPQTERP